LKPVSQKINFLGQLIHTITHANSPLGERQPNEEWDGWKAGKRWQALESKIQAHRTNPRMMPSIRERKMVGQEGEPQCAGQRPQKFVEIPTRRNSTPWRILATTSTIQLEIAAVKSSLLIQYIHIVDYDHVVA
jgi:hypothetical protein